MSGTAFRRTVLSILVVAFLLPLAGAHAAPADRSPEPLRMADWSRAVVSSFEVVLGSLRPLVDFSHPPKPGTRPTSSEQGREGNGFDPHGKP